MLIVIVIVILSLSAFLFVTGSRSLADKGHFFTTLANETGKLIANKDGIVDVISKMEGVYYDKLGNLHRENNPKTYGALYKELGIIFFDWFNLKHIYEISSEWKDLIETEAGQVKGYEVKPMKETVDHFKRFYSNAISVDRIEMGAQRVDMTFVVRFEVLNIIQVITKIKPDGIILAHAQTGFFSALQDILKKYSYEDFRDNVKKTGEDSPFIQELTKETNAIIERSFHLSISSIEMRAFDLSKGEPGDEDMEDALKQKEIEELKGDALIIKAQKEGDAQIELAKRKAVAKKIEGKGKGDHFKEVAKTIGGENIANYANLEQVKESNLLSFGSDPVKPIITVTTKNKEDKK